MNQSYIITPVLYLRRKSDNKGIIKLMVYNRNNKKQSYRSLKISLEKKYWNFNKNVVNKSHTNHEELNHIIRVSLEKETINIKSKFYISSNPFFTEYLKLFISAYPKTGTVKKYNTLKSHMTTHNLQFCSSEDIYLNDIDIYYVNSFHKYLLSKNLAPATIKTILRNLKTVLNKAYKQKVISNPDLHFIDIKISSAYNKKIYLNAEEVAVINDTIIPHSIEIYRQMMMFAIFTQGLRVSDLLLLKFSDITLNKDVVEFTIYKTKKFLHARLSYISKIAIAYSILHYLKLDNIENKSDLKFINSIRSSFQENFDSYISLSRAQNLLKLKNSPNNIWKVDDIPKFIENNIILNINGIEKGMSLEDIQEEKDRLINLLMISYKSLMEIVMANKIEDFVFPFLDLEDFRNFNKHNPSKRQENQIAYKSIIFNKGINEVVSEVGINKYITSKVLRRTYSNLALTHTEDLYALSKSLGHSTLKVTENYLRGFDSKKVNSLVDNIASKI